MSQDFSNSRHSEPYPDPTEEQPDMETLTEWSFDGLAEATDGCYPVEPDGFCEHNYPSWFLHLGLI